MSDKTPPISPPAISAFAATPPATPLSTARTGGIRALLADPAIQARLAGKGLTTAAAIAHARPADVAAALGEAPGAPAVKAAQAAAAAEVQFLDQVALGLAPGWKTDAFHLPGAPAGDCHCTDCESALSPAAYLTDLLDYVVTNVTHGIQGPPITLAELESMLHQPLSDLPTACGEIEEPVRQVRLAVEVLRGYRQGQPPLSFELTREQAYRFSVYTSLLTAAGASYTDLRAAVTDPTRAAAVADALGVSAEDLPDLVLAPGQMTEQAIEILFGLVDTTRDPFSTGPVAGQDPAPAPGVPGVVLRYELDNVVWGRDTDARGMVYARVQLLGDGRYEIALFRDQPRTQQVADGVASGSLVPPIFASFDDVPNSDLSGSAQLSPLDVTTPFDVDLVGMPRLLAFRQKRLRARWRDEDFPAPPLPDASPLIDPQVVGGDHVLTGVATDLWSARRYQVASRISALQQGRPADGPDVVTWLDGQLVKSLGVDGPTIAEWGRELDQGADVSAKLQPVGLQVDELRYLARVRSFVAGTVRAPVTEDEWYGVADVLWQVEKRKTVLAAWRELEKGDGLTLSPDFFVIPAAADEPLPSWRSTAPDLAAWEATLTARIAELSASRADLAALVSGVEERWLPTLRDSLVQWSFVPAAVDRETEILEGLLFIDLRASALEQTTRVATAIEALQELVLAARTGVLSASYPDLVFTPPQFTDGWKWLGSYATWRAAMGVLLYPENTLWPTVLPTQTPAFAALLDTIRSSATPLRPERARRMGCDYYDYMNDITSLTVHASCYAETSKPMAGGCGASTSPDYELRIHVFAQGGTTRKIYWSSTSDQPDGGQTFWQEVPGIGSFATVVGAVPFGVAADGTEASSGVPRGRHIYLFVQAFREGRDRLYVTRYDLDALAWDDQPRELIGPNGALFFDVAVEQRNELWPDRKTPDLHWEHAPIYVAFFVKDQGLFGAAFDCNELQWVRGGPSLITAQHEIPDGIVIDGLCGLVHIDDMSAIFVSASKGAQRSVWCTFVLVRGVLGTPSGDIVLDWPPVVPRDHLGWVSLRDEGGTWVGALVYPQSWGVYTFVKDGPQVYYGVARVPQTFNEQVDVVKAVKPDPVGLTRLSVHCGQRKGDVSARMVFQIDGLFSTAIQRSQDSIDFIELLPTWRIPLASKMSNLPGIVAGLSDDDLDKRGDALEKLYDPNQTNLRLYRTIFDEAYLAIPMEIAVELQRGGYYDDALDWLRTIYNVGRAVHLDDGRLDPRRKVYYGLRLEETLDAGFKHPPGWVLDPLNPHTVALTRANTYTRAVILAIAGCLVAYADSEFARGGVESIGRARELYRTARTVLTSTDLQQGEASCAAEIGTIVFPVGPQPPAPGARSLRAELESLRTSAAVRAAVDEVRHELAGAGTTSEKIARARRAVARIRAGEPRPPRLKAVIAQRSARAEEARAFLVARPEVERSARAVGAAAARWVAGASARLNDAAVPPSSYPFCVPPNPAVTALSSHVSLSLDKIQGGRDFAGELWHPDPNDGLGSPLVQQPAAATIAPTLYHYATLADRARQLTTIAQQVESSLLAALERRDAEAYSALKARQDLQLAGAGVRLRALGIVEADAEVDAAALQLARAQFQVAHFQQLILRGASVLELLGAGLQVAAAVAAVVAAGVVTGGTAIVVAAAAATALGASATAVSSFASLETRQDDWAYQLGLAQHDVAIAAQQIAVSTDKVAIAQQEQVIATMQADQAQTIVDFLANKFTGVELYEWMSDVLAGVYRYFLQQATAVARLAAAQLSFERQEVVPAFIRGDYWVPPQTSSDATTTVTTTSGTTTTTTTPANTAGLTGSVRLLADLTRLDQYALETAQRKLQLSRTISLAHVAPIDLEDFRRTGALTFATPMALFDRDFPGHYLRLIRQVRTSIIALVPPDQGICATLANKGLSRVVTGGTFAPVIVQRSPSSVALTATTNATGLFALDTQPELLLPFEGLGVDTVWELSLPLASNPFDFGTIADVLVTIDYTALDSAVYRSRVHRQLGDLYRAERPFSLRNDVADAWFELNNPCAGDTELRASFTVGPDDFAPNVRNVMIQHVTLYFAEAPGASFGVHVDQLELVPANVSPVPPVPPIRRVGPADSKNGVISSRMPEYGSWVAPPPVPPPPPAPPPKVVSTLAGSPYGKWTLSLRNSDVLPNAPTLLQRLACDDLRDVLLVITYTATTSPGPRDTVLSSCAAPAPPPPSGPAD